MSYLRPIAVAIALAASGSAVAGPVLIDGTDANDHGSVSGNVNQDGWFYIQRGFENLASQISPTVARVVSVYDTTANTQARNAVTSAFTRSSLPGAGWTINFVTPSNTFFQSLSTSSAVTTFHVDSRRVLARTPILILILIRASRVTSWF